MPLQAARSDSEKLRSRVQIVLGAEQIAMAEVGREPWEHSVEIAPFAIPSLQSVDSEGVAEIMAARSGAAAARLQAAAAKQESQGLGRVLDGTLLSVVSSEDESVGVFGGRIALEPDGQFPRQIAMKWDPSNATFAGPDSEDRPRQIQITPPQGERFADPHAGAIEHKHQDPETATGSRGASDVCGLSDDLPKFVL